MPEPQKVFASYDQPPYEGYAGVVYEQDGKWFEVHGSHCSCMGLEHQWDPEEIDLEAYRDAKAAGKRLISMPEAEAEFEAWFDAQIATPEEPL